MQAVYGAFFFPANSCDITKHIQSDLTDKGMPYRERHQLHCRVTLVTDYTTPLDRQRDLSTRETVIRAITSEPGLDFQFLDDGGLRTDLSLLNAGCEQRVRRVHWSTPEGGKSELSGKRTIEFVMEAVYPSLGNFGSIISLEESWTVDGDTSPYVVMHELADGIVEQTTRIATVTKAYQAGSAVGYLTWPNLGPYNGFPRQKFPLGFRGFRAQVSRQLPKERGHGFESHWGMRWSYYSESGLPYKI